MNDTNGPAPAVVSLMIPCRAEYVGVARLAILGVASRLNFSYDEVEDLRLAVGEACTSAIDRASLRAQTESPIQITCQIEPDELTVAVQYNLGRHTANGSTLEPEDELELQENSVDPENIGALLMEILVDSVNMETDAEGRTTVRLVKRVQGQ